jgi:MarR family transcriptional regulator, negative regulator of the multidrug operon emrRAB
VQCNPRSSNLLGAFVISVYDQMVQRIETEESISPQAASALVVIGFNRGRSVDFLSGALQLSHSGCVRLVDKLQEAQLVDRREGQDRRVVELYLTSTGQERMQSILRTRRRYLDGLLKSLSARQVKQFTDQIAVMLFEITTGDEHAEAMCRFCDETVCPQDSCPITLAVVK